MDIRRVLRLFLVRESLSELRGRNACLQLGYRVRDKRKMKMTEFMILSRRVFLRDNSLCRKTRTILVMALRSDFITAQ